MGNVSLLWGVFVSSFFRDSPAGKVGYRQGSQRSFPTKPWHQRRQSQNPHHLQPPPNRPGKSARWTTTTTHPIPNSPVRHITDSTELNQASWGENCTIQTELGQTNTGPVGSSHSPRLRAPSQPMANPTCGTNSQGTNQASVLLEEVQRLARSPSTGSTDPPGQPYVCCPQKRGRVETDHRSQIPEFLPRTLSFQDGGPLHVTHHPETPLGDGRDRSQRCLSDHPSGPETSLSVVIQGTHRAEDAIQLPTLRTLHRTLCVYKGHKANSAVSETARSPLNNVSDDLLLAAPNQSQLLTNLSTTLWMFTALVFVINLPKSITSAT